jgi:hypothetical protein
MFPPCPGKHAGKRPPSQSVGYRFHKPDVGGMLPVVSTSFTEIIGT